MARVLAQALRGFRKKLILNEHKNYELIAKDQEDLQLGWGVLARLLSRKADFLLAAHRFAAEGH